MGGQGKRHRRLAVALAVAGLLIACDRNVNPSSADQSRPERGGVYRVGVASPFGFTSGFDPSGEYFYIGFDIYSNLLLRTLVGYKHVAGAAGNELVPDLATEVPRPTDGGLTYTFHLKDGVKFGPPLSRAITSKDVAYSMERIGTPSVAAQYGFYYSVIEGMQEFSAGKAETISGIETPDPRTVVFHLTEPVGDFPYRMAMPATSPIPPEVGRCFEDAGQYGRYVIASGPYMIDGQPELDVSSCDSMEPLRGYDPQDGMVLVRNPDYDPATDSSAARESFPDEFHFVLDANVKDIYDKIASGELESAIVAQPPLSVLRRYSTDESLQPLIHREFSDAVAYINFVLTEPPFDDIHVRRAVNLVVDKAGFQQASGGAIGSAIATHILPPSLTGGHPTGAEYDPYATPGSHGDVEAARREMAQSAYDSDHDGMCDAAACKGVLHYTANVSPWSDILPIEEDSLGKIGITLDTRELADFYTPWQTISKSPPISSGGAWGKDYADAYTYMGALFDSNAIAPVGNSNVALVGLTPDLARKYHVDGNVSNVPSVDAEIAECARLIGPERTRCWVELDKKLMEDVVPWAPWAWFYHVDILSPAVTSYEFDQFSGLTGFAHVAVDESKQRGL